MFYYVLDTLSEFNECNNACYDAHMTVHDDNNGYTENTLSWSKPYQRLTDGKYVCPVCPDYDNAAGYTIEESQPDWFPVPNP